MLAPCTELIRRRHPTDEERASLTGQLLREPQPAQIAALVERGADVDCGALARAASEGDVDRTRALLSLKADPNNGSPLHAACRAGSLECVRALRQHGAEARRPDANGRLPADAAAAAWRKVRRRRRREGHYSNDNDDDDERRYREVLRTLPAKPLHAQRQVGRRCKGLTLKGTRCLVTSCTRNPAAAPLRKGERFCAHHACQACDFPDDEVAPARPVRTELTADQTLELLSTLAGVERPSSRERRRPATASPDIAELHSRRLNIEQRIVDATRQVRELQELGRVIAT